MRYIKILTFTLILVALSITTVFAAPTYKDVTSSHWAYSAIVSMADKQYMVGDAAGNFRPDALLDKFETCKILSRIAGYKYTGATEEEQTYYNRAYEKNKAFINKYASLYTRWNSAADKEIAFLLEQEILTAEDLNQFVVKDQSDSERLRALSKEEAAVFIIRLIKKKTEALNFNSSFKFKDDSAMNLIYKPYIYYLKELNIVTGDNNNNYNPRSAVTRAMFAVMLDKSLKYYVKPSTKPVEKPNDLIKLQTISGTIDNIYPQLKGIQIVTPDGEKKIYKLSSMVSVYIDNFLKTVDDLQEGMDIIGIVISDEITDIKAQTKAAQKPIEPQTFEGYVVSTDKDGDVNTITIELRNLNPRGEIISQNRTYSLKADTEIKRGKNNVEFSTITSREIVTATVVGDEAVSLILEERDLEIKNGIVLDKRLDEETPVFVVKNPEGKEFELQFMPESIATRFGVITTDLNQIRIGDLVNIKANYNQIVTIYAQGSLTTIEGTVEEIFISKERSYIRLAMANNVVKKYEILSKNVDIYSLRLGAKVSVKLQSQEVESVKVLEVE